MSQQDLQPGILDRIVAERVKRIEQAKQDAAIAHGYRAVLTVGARFALWVELLLRF